MKTTMDKFYNALLETPSAAIPPEDDWYAPLIGDWEFDYLEPEGRKVKGEWFFRKVLDGTCIEDIFICPSRATAKTNPQPDGEYGVAIRMYNAKKRCYDMTYSCAHHTMRLEIHKVGERIECTVLEDTTNKWFFSEITESTFHWQNVTVQDDGSEKLICEVFARRV